MEPNNPFFKECYCRQCDGSGEIPFKYGSTKCPLCNGVGIEASKLGQDLEVFLKTRFAGRF